MKEAPRVALVVPRMAGGEEGGAEILFRELHRALESVGAACDLVSVPCSEADFDEILRSYARCYDRNLDEYDLVVSTKAPTYLVRHRNHVSLLVHTPRVFYDRFETEFPNPTEELRRQRRMIRELDLAAFAAGRIRARLAIGRPVVDRLAAADDRWRELPFRIVDLPPCFPPGEGRPAEDFFLLPGRLHRWKRVDLAIRAVRRLPGDTALLITGTGEDEERFRAAAADDPRIRFLGRVPEAQLRDLYARCLAVPFVPVEEDFGFVTVEAFARGRPVVTCTDSGQPAAIVRASGGGLVIEPDPAALADALRLLRDEPARRDDLGRRGLEFVRDLSWKSLASDLLAAGGLSVDDRPRTEPTALADLRLAVLDTQPIEPPVGGGRLRLFGLYRTLDEHARAVYVGSYDWRGPGRRVVRHPPRLEERTVPHSEEHFAAADALSRLCGGAVVIDVSQPLLVHLSPELLAEARAAIDECEVVVFSHPWLYPPLADDVRRRGRPLVYDSQNVEWKLRRELLAGTPAGRALAESVGFWEGELCRRADRILACSEEDRLAFVDLYGVDPDRVDVVPNGVDTQAIAPADAATRAAARRALGLRDNRPVAVFIGSAYGPNVDAARWICDELARELAEWDLLVVGGVGAVLGRRGRRANAHVLGAVDDGGRLRAFHAADVALNPVPYGSGTNIKMFDYMAAGLAIVSTPAGARGIDPGSPPAFVIDELPSFAPTLERLRVDLPGRAALGDRARRLACETYDWARLSRRVAGIARSLHAVSSRRSVPAARCRRPLVSVVVPSLGRPEGLARLLGCLERQTFRDFEVVLVEQGERRSPLLEPGAPLRHVLTPVRGAVRARNTGLALARGDLMAFVDDDCLPDPAWLAALVAAFDDRAVVGVEGLIVPDVPDADPSRSRIVTNDNFEGLGFLTANLAVRRSAALALSGFDEIFDHPHFREDTDFGWRLLERGLVPFVREARVVHPVADRTDPRESAGARARFFEKDPVLFEKHPERYPRLFAAEEHYRRTPGFWEAFRHGIAKYEARIPVTRLLEDGSVRPEALPDWLRDLASA